MHSQRPIAIVGFMGSGKSVVARILSARLNRNMVDLDALITERHGRTPAHIIEDDGEPVFRTIETSVLTDLLREGFTGVIALGGGAWTELPNRLALAEHKALTVWLDAPFEVCWHRIESSQDVRPLAPTKDKAKSLFVRRRETYALANLRVEVPSDETLESTVLQVELAVAKML